VEPKRPDDNVAPAPVAAPSDERRTKLRDLAVLNARLKHFTVLTPLVAGVLAATDASAHGPCPYPCSGPGDLRPNPYPNPDTGLPVLDTCYITIGPDTDTDYCCLGSGLSSNDSIDHNGCGGWGDAPPGGTCSFIEYWY
jgi:hypothetical protein